MIIQCLGIPWRSFDKVQPPPCFDFIKMDKRALIKKLIKICLKQFPIFIHGNLPFIDSKAMLTLNGPIPDKVKKLS